LAINYAAIAMTINPALWEAHKEQIENLYYTCNLELEHVIYVIGVYGFIAGPTSYKAQLKKWNDARDMPLSKNFQWHLNQLLIALIMVFWHRNYSPKRMLHRLRTSFGFYDLIAKSL
jgi:hypothetical protein